MLEAQGVETVQGGVACAHFIEYHVADAVQIRLELQSTQQDPSRHEHEPDVLRSHALEPHLKAVRVGGGEARHNEG